ncbi:glycosyltransferase [Paenibacillus sp. FJAT-27812]|uniref:glycosyltransferase n=1 Tax=Paenibacillus sp. FJAT-27812 TaxID=1684143 RepID=UPI001E4F3C34|nr:glycosyltransferase [Paenibacillus sp. FJAT-27812]
MENAVVDKIKRIIIKLLYKLTVPFKKSISLVIPTHVLQKAKKNLLDMTNSGKYKKQESLKEIGTKGVNLIGYSRAEMGIGESCRLAANTISNTGIPFGIINFSGTNSSRKTDLSWIHKEINEPLYNINVFHINAEQMPEINLLYGDSLFLKRYNIGFWHWELPDFPDEWLESFNYVDEIWVPSTYVWESISLKSPVPVVKIPHSIEVKIMDQRNRESFDLPETSFLFLTMYDINSIQERKNPQASIESFKLAFGPEDMSVGLVVKINGSIAKVKENSYLSELVENYKNVYIIDGTISRNDINSLMNIIDSFISLHRSEGFGLGFAEAMYLRKPVIGTNWSSNTDFMKHTNSCLVNYELIPLGKDYGPYKAYQYWANPDINHAAEYMAKLVNDKVYYNVIACEGQAYIKKHYSPQRVGELVKKRLNYIYMWKFGG